MNANSESNAAPPAMPVPCAKCRRGIGPADAFCRFCGARQHTADPFYYHPVWILVLSFLVLGPLALGLVWRARAINPAMKAVLAAVILVYSAFTFYAAYVLFDALYRHFSLLGQVL